MRAITKISIQKSKISEKVTMFLTYNNNESDYSFNNFENIEEALESLPKNDPYFPLKCDSYRLVYFTNPKKK